MQSDGTYGEPVYVAKLERLRWNFEADTDEIKAYGMFTDGLATYPAFDVEQNQFRRASTEFSAYAPDVANRRLYAQDQYETAGGVPTTAQGFADFFAEFTG